jgi:hypothetical protein
MDETVQTFIPDPIQISYGYINMRYGLISSKQM